MNEVLMSTVAGVDHRVTHGMLLSSLQIALLGGPDFACVPAVVGRLHRHFGSH